MQGVRNISGWGRGGLWGWAGSRNLPAHAACGSGAEGLQPYCVLNKPKKPVKGRGGSFSDVTSVSSTVTDTSSGSLHEGRNVAKAISTLRRAQAVCFDVDSTILQEEGIDILARFCGAEAEVARLTTQAMEGGMKFEDAMAARLNLMKPSSEDVSRCLREHPPRLSNGASELVSALHARGTHVYLVSGGFRVMINPVAAVLGIDPSRIYANTIHWHPDGSFSGFDTLELTSRDGGKPEVVRTLKKEHNYNSVVMVGDGATDMQACPPAEAFIGYGGVSVRDAVREGADWYVFSLYNLLDVLLDESIDL